jgi:ribosomal protein RSM22 (predicted rRNA methylase)
MLGILRQRQHMRGRQLVSHSCSAVLAVRCRGRTGSGSTSAAAASQPDTTNNGVVGGHKSSAAHPPAPFHELIRHSARCTWRANSQPPPVSLTNIRADLIKRSGKTGRQLRRTNEHIVSIHQVLAERRERERRDLVNARYRRARPDSLESRRRAADDARAKPISYGPEQTLASLRYRLVPNFFMTRRVLSEARSLLGREFFRPKRIIDAGCGVGSASAAALDLFGVQSVDWIHCVDPSRSMRDGCVQVLRGMIDGAGMADEEDVLRENSFVGHRRGQRHTRENQQQKQQRRTRITMSETLSDGSNYTTSSSSSRSGMSKQSIGSSGSGTGSFDLALCTWTASELPHVASSLAMAAILWEKLCPNGVLVLIEPGTPDGFSSIRAVRNMLLDCCPPDDRHSNEEDKYGERRQEGDEEAHIVAPCTHAHACPMERHQKHHFASKRGWNEEFGADDDDVEVADDDPNLEGHPDWNDTYDYDIDFMDATESDASLSASTATSETDAFERAFCSFVHVTPGDNGPRSEKFSYLVVQKRIAGASPTEMALDRANNQFHGEKVADLLAASIASGEESMKDAELRKKKHFREVGDIRKHLDLIQHASDLEARFLDSDEDELALELVRGDAARSTFGRIVRAPLKRRGLIMVDYCSGASENKESETTTGDKKGRIVRHKISRRVSSRVAPGLYAAARKARWGGLWPDIR